MSDEQKSGGLLETLANVNDELKAVRAEQAALRSELAAMREQHGIGMDHGHANLVLDKWHHHDRPAPEAEETAKPLFDPMTGEKLVSQRQAEARQLYS